MPGLGQGNYRMSLEHLEGLKARKYSKKEADASKGYGSQHGEASTCQIKDDVSIRINSNSGL